MILRDLLDTAGVVVHVSAKANEVTLNCPFCVENDEPADTRFRLGINLVSGFSHCFHCHWKSSSFRFTLRELGRVFGIKVSVRRALTEENMKREPVKEVRPRAVGLPREYEAFSGKKGDDVVERAAFAYLKKRNISLSQIIRHKIGYAAIGDLAWRVLFPVIAADGKVYGCVGRALVDTQKQKYLNTAGTKIMWGGIKTYGTAVVCEGIIDALKVEQALLQIRNHVPMARLGSTITASQLDQLRPYSKVIILPDWDVPGVQGAIAFASQCDTVGIRTFVSIPDRMTGEDPGDMEADRILSSIQDAKPWSEHTNRRLQAAALKRAL